ncbi:MAG: hypothetical protein MHM6MM_007844, partial [Cercozoa sp. M6MM]
RARSVIGKRRQVKPAVAALRVCHHIAVLSSSALTCVGLSDSSEAPPGGHLDRLPDGSLSGVIREAAMASMHAAIAASENEQEQVEECLAAMRLYLRNGVTCVQTNDADGWKVWHALLRRQQNDLPLRVLLTAMYADVFDDESSHHKTPQPSAHPLLVCERIKIFTDGSLGAQTAALSLPYQGDDEAPHRCSHVHGHGSCGLLQHEQPALEQMARTATQHAWRLELHAIGDRAAGAVIDAVEAVGAKRAVLTHAQILSPAQIARMRELGIVASIQPQFVSTDATWAEERLHPTLRDWSYQWKTLLQQGVRCAGGSDAPIEVPDALLGICDAMCRPRTKQLRAQAAQCYERQDAVEDVVFRPEERLDAWTALALYTEDAAYCYKREHEQGQLRPGFLADFTVLDSSARFWEQGPACLVQGSRLVRQTWVHGRCRHDVEFSPESD